MLSPKTLCLLWSLEWLWPLLLHLILLWKLWGRMEFAF